MNRVHKVDLELLSSTAITGALSSPYWRVSVIEETSSTQTLLRESNPTPGSVIATEFQSAGRGRLDRTFDAPKSSALLFSFYIEPKLEKDKFGFISLIAGLATAKSISELTKNNKFECKWPNDLLFDGKKVAGLLAEVYGDGIIVGIGINVSTLQAQLPVPTATSIFLATGQIVNRNNLLTKLLENFEGLLKAYEAGEDLTSAYVSKCGTIGREVLATLPGGTEVRGIAIAIDSSGGLILDSGAIITVGDLIHLTNYK